MSSTPATPAGSRWLRRSPSDPTRACAPVGPAPRHFKNTHETLAFARRRLVGGRRGPRGLEQRDGAVLSSGRQKRADGSLRVVHLERPRGPERDVSTRERKGPRVPDRRRPRAALSALDVGISTRRDHREKYTHRMSAAERRELPNSANSRTTRTPERRELPNDANSRTARTPERRVLPNGAYSRTARPPEGRELPKGANSRRARPLERRVLPNGANSRRAPTPEGRQLLDNDRQRESSPGLFGSTKTGRLLAGAHLEHARQPENGLDRFSWVSHIPSVRPSKFPVGHFESGGNSCHSAAAASWWREGDSLSGDGP